MSSISGHRSSWKPCDSGNPCKSCGKGFEEHKCRGGAAIGTNCRYTNWICQQCWMEKISCKDCAFSSENPNNSRNNNTEETLNATMEAAIQNELEKEENNSSIGKEEEKEQDEKQSKLNHLYFIYEANQMNQIILKAKRKWNLLHQQQRLILMRKSKLKREKEIL